MPAARHLVRRTNIGPALCGVSSAALIGGNVAQQVFPIVEQLPLGRFGDSGLFEGFTVNMLFDAIVHELALRSARR